MSKFVKSNFYKPQLKDFISLVNVLGIEEEELKSIYIINRLTANWKEIVGEGFAYHSKPLKYKENILNVLIVHEAYRMEFNFNKNIILRNIKKILEDDIIKHIHYKVGDFRRKKKEVKNIKETLEGKESLIKILSQESDQKAYEKLLDLVKIMK